ncbi:hypothetical protein DY023_04065 [Microbacterium bovistercoris]|uniref:Uncharacterized protein n=1 Tax=Microbacterium bovistercoris TaxID=2293570 RepID=A0A371NWI4_9MICO|nr:hypothetical protein [Microbacterium bovistercoris]REJ07382.1 hypothetical protein DY023_04065 [Microbacterium bovistercoris]
MLTVAQPKVRAWNDVEWRDRYLHIIDDDEHAADMLAEVFSGVDQRHPFALCGVSLVCFGPNRSAMDAQPYCPECLALCGPEDSAGEYVPERARPAPTFHM